jgi:DNA-binding FadR family transcriptional regulator
MDVAAHRKLYEAIRRHDPMRAQAAAERIVGIAMLGVEAAIRLEEQNKAKDSKDNAEAVAIPPA